MTDDEIAPSARARARAASLMRHKAKAACRAASLEALAAGWTVEQIAELRNVSPRTIRREINAALDERPVMAPARYAGLQIARLTKVVRVADVALDQGDLRAVALMIKAVQALDRYHGLAGSPVAALSAPRQSAALPAPPLRLTHGAHVEIGTGFGAQGFEDAEPAPVPHEAGAVAAEPLIGWPRCQS